MTIEDFKNTSFYYGMTMEYNNETYFIASVDFKENLIGLDDGITECDKCGCEQTIIKWVRCENCKIVED